MPRLTPLRRAILVSLASITLLAPFASAAVVRTFTFSPGDVRVARDEHGARLTIEGSQPWGTVKGPELPAVSALIDLPAGTRATRVTARAIEFAALPSVGRVRPMQPPSLADLPAAWSEPDPALYASTDWSPGALAQLGPTGGMRGRALASVVLQPVQIVPATGEARVATRIEVSVETESEPDAIQRRRVVAEWEDLFGGLDVAMRSAPPYARQGLTGFRPMIPSLDAERVERPGDPRPFAPTALPSVVGSPVQYLIITNAAMESSFQSLADWKTEQGVPAVVRTTEFINANYPFGVDLAERIRLFIRDAYAQWGTVWVLLGGDTPVVPVRTVRTSFFGGNNLVTDLYYSDLDGNWDADGDSLFGEGDLVGGDGLDLYPDVYVGRAPVQTPAEAALWVNKDLTYDRTPASGYLCKALYFAEVLFPQEWQPGDSIASDGASIAQHAVQRLSGCMTATRLYQNHVPYAGSLPLTKRAVIDSVTAGYNILHHVGHGFRNTMSCGDSSLTNPDVLLFANAPKYSGLVYAIDCTSAAIDFESIGEDYLLAPNGGAVNNVGSTNFDFPATGDGYQNEFYDLLFSDGVTRLGQTQAMQKLPFVAFSNTDNVQRWTQFTILLLGDPQIELWTSQPTALGVTHPSTMALSDTSVTVTVLKSGVPAAGALVCLQKGTEDYRVGTTNGAGQITLPFRPQTLGVAKVTVTLRDWLPYRGTLTVTPTASAALVTRAVDRVLDDSGLGTDANANGVLDAGETVNLTIPARNVGSAATGAVSGTLLSLDPRVQVTIGAGTYGVIAGNTTQNGTTYRIHVNRPSVRDGDEMRLRLRLTDGTGTWANDQILTVRAPSLRHAAQSMSDGGTGNGDQNLDVGETATFSVTLLNTGEGSARNVSAQVLAAVSGLNVLDGTSTYGSIPAKGQATGDTFQVQNVSASSSDLILVVSDQYGELYRQRINFGAPAPASAVDGAGSASAITLVWTKSPAADLSGYNIYRSSNPGGPWTKRNYIADGRIAFYRDEGLPPLTLYYYYVTAVDSSSTESSPSAVISASTNPQLLNGFPIPMGRTTPSSPVIGDIERDGQLEVAVGSDVLYVWHADGHAPIDADGSERTSGDFTNQGSYYASAPAITDLDNDGVMDIVAPTYDSKQLFVFEPDGSTKPGFPVALDTQIWSSPACGDIDGDGIKEIVFTGNSNAVYCFKSNGTEFRDGDSTPSTIGVFATIGAGFNFGSPALADLDGDGKLDIIVAGKDGKIWAWKYTGAQVSGFPYGPVSSFTGSPAVGDIDNDGQLEIVVLDEGNVLHVVKQNGSSEPGFPKTGIMGGGNSRTPSPALIDMDGDGKREIVVAGTDGLLRIFRWDGSVYPGWSGVRFSSKFSNATESSPVGADLDGDGQIEILMGSEDGDLAGFRSDGSPLAGFPIHLDGEVRGTPMIWDFDQNGGADIVLADWDKNLYVWQYPGTYHPNPSREWVMFRHDGERTGRLGAPIVVAVEQTAMQTVETIEGGVRLRWKLPTDALGGRGAWRAYRKDGPAGATPSRLTAVPDGYVAVGDGPRAADVDGAIAIEDYRVVPGSTYSYVLARVDAGPGEAPLAFGPYGVLSPGEAPAHVYLTSPFPNPGAGSQTLAFGLPEGLPAGARATIDLYDVRGSLVRHLMDRPATPGRYVVAWDGRDGGGRTVASGMYLVRFRAGPYDVHQRIVRLGR